MRLNQKAQSKIEYALLWVLVFVALLLMVPYVFRGINAMFESMDDQVQDSFNDPLKSAPPGDYNLPPVKATH